MEQLKEQVLIQLQRIQEGAEKSIKAGGEFYFLRASCALELSKNVQKLLQECSDE